MKAGGCGSVSISEGKLAEANLYMDGEVIPFAAVQKKNTGELRHDVAQFHVK